MILTANSEVVRQARRKTGNGWLTTFIGQNRNTLQQGQTAPTAGVLYPMAFLVEKEPHAVTKPHFHEADQNQVIVQGGGRLGTHGVGTVAVHYTDAWSAYGPIVAAEEGISWFTLRNTWDSGARTCRPHADSYVRRGRRTFSTARRPRRRCRLPRPRTWHAPTGCPASRSSSRRRTAWQRGAIDCRRVRASVVPIRAAAADSSGSCCPVLPRRARGHTCRRIPVFLPHPMTGH